MKVKDIMSMREMNTAEINQVVKRYKDAGAAGQDGKGSTFLHQQRETGGLIHVKMDETELRSILEQREIPWNESYLNRTKTYIASDETVDSYGDIIKQDGWDFERFEKNPVGIWCHNYNQMPISSCIKFWVENGNLYITHLFALPEDYSFADTIFKMVDSGFLKGNSVGFIPKKILYVEDEDERKQLGLGKWGVVFLEQLLLEDTICPIGANPSALVQDSFVSAAQKGIISRDELKRGIIEERNPESIKELCDKVVSLIENKITVVPKSEGIQPDSEPENKKGETTAGETSARDIQEMHALLKELNNSTADVLEMLKEIENNLAEIKSAIGEGGDIQPEKSLSNNTNKQHYFSEILEETKRIKEKLTK